MFGKFFRQSLSKGQNFKALNRLSAMNFSPAVNQKLGIGDAADIIEQKISGISQVVSLTSNIYRTISRNSVKLSLSEMVSPESLVLLRCKQEKWLSSAQESRVWP